MIPGQKPQASKKFRIEHMFNSTSIRQMRPSSARAYESSKQTQIREIVKQHEKENTLKPIQSLNTFKIHQTLYRVKREEEQLHLKMGQKRVEILKEADVCRLVNSNDIDHIIKINAKKDSMSESSLWIQRQKESYLQSKVSRKILQEKMKSHQSQGMISTRNDTSEQRVNKTENHIEVFGRKVSVKGSQDRKKIKHRIESFMDKYHSQTSMVIKEEREEREEQEEREEEIGDDNRMILTQPVKAQHSSFGLNIHAKQIVKRQLVRPQSAQVRMSSRPSSGQRL